MNGLGSLLGLVLGAAAQRLAGFCLRRAGLSPSQPIRWVGGRWCTTDPEGRETTLWYREGDSHYPVTYWAAHSLGPLVAVTEWSPDGIGTTRVFWAREQMVGAVAREFLRQQELREQDPGEGGGE